MLRTPSFSAISREDDRLGRMKRICLLIIIAVWAADSARAQTPIEPVAAVKSHPLYRMRPPDALLLGIVEGVTEFLPISSTGHLIIVTELLGLNNDYALADNAGNPIWLRKPTEIEPGELLTPRIANEAYIVVIQFGAIAAIIPICWSQFVLMWRGVVFRREPRGQRLFVNVIIAFLPAAVLGLLLHDWIDKNLFSKGAVAFALIGGALVMFVADRWGRALQAEGRNRELTPHGAAWIGFLQCLTMWPGVGRPMMTIVGGYLNGLAPGPAAGFSFLLGFVTLSAATIYKSMKSGPLIVEIFGWQSVLIGIVVAGITASLSARFFIKLLLERGLKPFAWYRIALAGALLFAPG
jgi:undecaprenyl-diphosphatase